MEFISRKGRVELDMKGYRQRIIRERQKGVSERRGKREEEEYMCNYYAARDKRLSILDIYYSIAKYRHVVSRRRPVFRENKITV